MRGVIRQLEQIEYGKHFVNNYSAVIAYDLAPPPPPLLLFVNDKRVTQSVIISPFAQLALIDRPFPVHNVAIAMLAERQTHNSLPQEIRTFGERERQLPSVEATCQEHGAGGGTLPCETHGVSFVEQVGV